MLYGRLPVPAHISPQNKRDFGAEGSYMSRFGIVPFKALGLSENDIKDGYGSFFTYIVHSSLSDKACIYDFWNEYGYLKRDIKQQIDVLNAEGSSVFVPKITLTRKLNDTIAIVLISHGPSRIGAQSVHKNKSNINGGISGNKKKNIEAMKLAGNDSSSLLIFYLDSYGNEKNFDFKIWHETRYGILTRYSNGNCIIAKLYE